jgi:uncharacterized protein YjbI with pentapeptide repeats
MIPAMRLADIAPRPPGAQVTSSGGLRPATGARSSGVLVDYDNVYPGPLAPRETIQQEFDQMLARAVEVAAEVDEVDSTRRRQIGASVRCRLCAEHGRLRGPLAALIVGLVLLAGSDAQIGLASSQAAPPTAARAAPLALESARLQLLRAERTEVLQEADSKKAADGVWRVILPVLAGLLGTLLTVFVAFLAIVLPLRTQRRKDRTERERAARADIVQRERDIAQRRAAAITETKRLEREQEQRMEAAQAALAQREAAEQDLAEQRRKELVQRSDAAFASALLALADPNPAAQAAGAATLRRFLGEDASSDFREQTYHAVRAQLDRRIAHPDAVRAILADILTALLREHAGLATEVAPARTRAAVQADGTNLTRIWLQRADLRGLELSGADIYKADLRRARLDGARLRRALGWGVTLAGASLRGADLEEARLHSAKADSAVFDDARLVSANLEEAELDGARFRGAKLQSARFAGASLRGVDFRGAQVRDAHFLYAEFDDIALSSLVGGSELWLADATGDRGRFTATFDWETRERLVVLAARQGKIWDPA